MSFMIGSFVFAGVCAVGSFVSHRRARRASWPHDRKWVDIGLAFVIWGWLAFGVGIGALVQEWVR